MSDSSDDVQNYALAVIAGVVALVIGGVIALAAATTAAPRAAPAASATPVEPPAMTAPVVYFELDSDALPAEAADLLAGFAEALRGNAGATVLISGYHDASGDPQHNAELAKRRAQAVQHALQANGVAPGQLQLAKPALSTGGADPREARRVELHLQ